MELRERKEGRTVGVKFEEGKRGWNKEGKEKVGEGAIYPLSNRSHNPSCHGSPGSADRSFCYPLHCPQNTIISSSLQYPIHSHLTHYIYQFQSVSQCFLTLATQYSPLKSSLCCPRAKLYSDVSMIVWFFCILIVLQLFKGKRLWLLTAWLRTNRKTSDQVYQTSNVCPINIRY